MSDKQHFTIVRNAGYTATEFKTRQRHNERQNEKYHNGDIISERSALNFHYQKYLFPDCTPVTYEERFNQLLASVTIAKRGLKPDAKVFAELVFGVNSEYFEQNGGYKFAKQFFDEVYNLAVKEVGDKRYILSAVLHADERNGALSEQYGHDVFHYHLHVVYVPVVEKKVYYRKDMKDKEKAGTLKEIIPQISHSKKWPIKTPVVRDGQTFQINSYSLLQDRYHEHMIAADYPDLLRGERGSTTEHLEVLDYKIQQDKKRLAAVSEQVEQSESRLGGLEMQAEKKEAKVKTLDAELSVKEKAKATVAEINAMGHTLPIVPGIHLTDTEVKRLKALAKKSVNADNQIAESKKKMAVLNEQISELNAQLRDAKAEVNHWHREYTTLWNEVKDFIGAIRKFPVRLREFVAELFRHEREAAQVREQEQIQPTQKNNKSIVNGR